MVWTAGATPEALAAGLPKMSLWPANLGGTAMVICLAVLGIRALLFLVKYLLAKGPSVKWYCDWSYGWVQEDSRCAGRRQGNASRRQEVSSSKTVVERVAFNNRHENGGWQEKSSALGGCTQLMM